MAARTPAEAVNNFLGPLQRVISCVTQAQLNVKGGYYPTTDEPHALVLADGLPQKLPGETDLSLVVKQFYYVIRVEEPDRGPWRVSTAEYNYNLRDADNRVVLAFHWHPAERFKVRHPHLHLDQGARLGHEDLHRTHIPTGRISIEEVIRFVITELRVEPLRGDWEKVLSEAESARQSWRTWS